MESDAPAAAFPVDIPKIRIGTAGWSYKDWEGIFYPSGMQRN